MDCTQIAELLGKNGHCVVPNFLSPAAMENTRRDLDQIHIDKLFKRAAVGRGTNKNVHDEVRRDEIHWLDRDDSNLIQAELWEKLDALKLALNRTLFMGLHDFEGHYSIYLEGGYYRRHLDSFKTETARTVSIVIYLNRDWQTGDGGRLRIHHADQTHTDIDPVGGTLVCFLSRESEHEVLINHADRFSFAGWFKTKV